MATSPNKGYELIVTGTEVDTWGAKLNTDVFGRVDDNLGGITTKSLTNVAVNLTAAESRTLRLVLNGTLTGNVLITTLAIGMTIIENACTGPFTVTFQKNGVGTPVAIPNGTNTLVTTGASGNPALIGVDFPTGTRIPFQQTTPPAGYTKDTASAGLNNSALRLVTGPVTNGGTYDFSAVFATGRVPTGVVGNTAITEAQMPFHGHPAWINTGTSSTIDSSGALALESNGPGAYPAYVGSLDNTPGHQIGGTGGGQVHGHSLTMDGMEFQVRFFDFVIGVKV